MATVRIDALVARYTRALSSNSTASAAPTVATLTALPTSDVFDVAPFGAVGHGAVRVVPFAKGGDGTTFDMYVIGYGVYGSSPDEIEIVPSKLYVATLTCGTLTGHTGRLLGADEFLADTVVPSFSNENVSCESRSPADNWPVHIAIDTKGFKYLKFFFNNVTSTSANALIAPF